MKYRGMLWSILNWLNEDQIVVYTTRPPGQHRTITLTDRMLSLPTQAELLAARLAGENPKVVSERLGHSSVVMTLDTYSR